MNEPIESVLNLSVLEQLKKDTGADSLSDMITIFIDEASGRILKIEKAFEKNEISVIAAEAHVLKSTSATFGAVAVNKLAASLEEACRQNSRDTIGKNIFELKEAFECAKKALKINID